MGGWMNLTIVLPAIFLAVALLLSFAGCDRVFGLTEITPTVPAIDSAMGKDGTTVTLIWHWDGTPDHYQFERKDADGNTTNFDAPSPAAPFDDTGLAPAATYTYRVRGVFTNGDTSGWSSAVMGTTLPFTSAYSKPLTSMEGGWEGYTLVLRIEAAHLSATGPHVRVTVQAASPSGASIDRIYISQASPTGNPWDSASDLTPIYDLAANQNQPFIVPAGAPTALPIVAYTINRFQALLIAVDFTPSSTSSVEAAPSILTSEASTYYLQTAMGEAALQTRSPGFILDTGTQPMTSLVTFITNIEVG